MAELNYLRMAQILGGTLHKCERPTFGGFAAPKTARERFRLLKVPKGDGIEPQQLPLIKQAFEVVRQGFEPDRVLVDPELSKEFLRRAKSLGVHADATAINRKLQYLRKAPPPGLKLDPTTRAAGLTPEPYFYACELAFVQLSYREDVSIDDVVTDPRVGEEFVRLAKAIKPEGRAVDFKWAVLRLRKMRAFNRKKKENLLSLESSEIEHRFKTVGTLENFSLDLVPASSGLYAFAQRQQKDRYLYVGSATRNLREAVEPFEGARPFYAIAGQFWRPSLESIDVRVAAIRSKDFRASPRDLSLRLIEERHPLFNVPVEIKLTVEGDEKDEQE